MFEVWAKGKGHDIFMSDLRNVLGFRVSMDQTQAGAYGRLEIEWSRGRILVRRFLLFWCAELSVTFFTLTFAGSSHLHSSYRHRICSAFY